MERPIETRIVVVLSAFESLELRRAEKVGEGPKGRLNDSESTEHELAGEPYRAMSVFDRACRLHPYDPVTALGRAQPARFEVPAIQPRSPRRIAGVL